jgi:glutaryl-CoA dehydrogenase
MAAAPAREQLYFPPPVDSDYYKFLDVLEAKERTIAQHVREVAEAEVALIIEDYWLRDEFPMRSYESCRH